MVLPEQLWDQRRKLHSLAPHFRVRVGGILLGLESMGHPPHIVFAWRSEASQLWLVEHGRSKTMRSQHCVGVEGDGLAADIVHAEHWWGAGEDQSEEAALAFFADLGRLAKGEGLTWGGDWPPISPDTGMGWDPGHIEWTR